ncbi:MAG: metallophosphoesterase [Candidatus Nanopelagicales bacterium]
MPTNPWLRSAATLVAAAGAGLAYAAAEARSYRLRRLDVPCLSRGQRPLRVLHLTDLHMTPGQHRKQVWVRQLAALQPDLVVNTGDNLAHVDAVPFVLDALGPLLDGPGVFVMGSNDYYAPTFRNPARYLVPSDERRLHGGFLPWEDLRDGFTTDGWVDLDNARTRFEIDGRTLDLVGVDDPHIYRDRYDEVSAPKAPDADLVLGVVHAPYHRVIDKMSTDGCDLVLAGHTHGGQLCVPGVGALVTNCDLERSRASGLSWLDGAYLHVSAGLGTSPYAPVRFACPPEATLLTLIPRPA